MSGSSDTREENRCQGQMRIWLAPGTARARAVSGEPSKIDLSRCGQSALPQSQPDCPLQPAEKRPTEAISLCGSAARNLDHRDILPPSCRRLSPTDAAAKQVSMVVHNLPLEALRDRNCVICHNFLFARRL